MPQNKLVGNKTGQTTQHGRDVYKTSKGENVSEISITFPIGDKWYNAPSIYNGKQYSEDEVVEMVKSGKVKPTSVHDNMKDAVSAAEKRSAEMEYAKGGDTMNKQMKMFQDGGMMDNSGEVVNGTEVPAGSLRSEVADDIPAKLSEGEFVLPADVVRFIGLEKLMQMRDAAKAGLARMQEMGQMGNSQEVANPDQSFAGEEDTSGFESEIDSIMQEVDGEPQFRVGGLASGTNLSKAPSNPVIDVRYFKSDDGRSMYITFYRGKPMTAIPDGFKEVTAEEARQVGQAADTKAETTKSSQTQQALPFSGEAGSVDGTTPSDSTPSSSGSQSGAVVGSTSHGGITANSGMASVLGGLFGGIVAGPIGGALGKVVGSKLGAKTAVSQSQNAIANNLGANGFSMAAINAAEQAAATASSQSGATAGSIAAAAAQAAANVDNVDPLDAMFAVTNNFSQSSAAPIGSTPAAPSTAVSVGNPSSTADASAAYGGTPTGVANVGPSQPSGESGSSDGGVSASSVAGSSMGIGSVGDDATGPEGESGDGGDGGFGSFGGVWAKGGLVKKRKQPAKKPSQKGIASKK